MKNILAYSILSLTSLTSVSASAENAEYLVVNFYGPNTEEHVFTLPLSENIRSKLKSETLVCSLKIPDSIYLLGFTIDARPGVYLNNAIVSRMALLKLPSLNANPTEGELLTESKNAVTEYKNISLSLKFNEDQNKQYFLNLGHNLSNGLGNKAKEYLEFPIHEYKEGEVLKDLFSCYFYKE